MGMMTLEEYGQLSGTEKRERKGRNTPEMDEQIKLFEVLRDPVYEKLHPEAKCIFSTLSGRNTSKAVRGREKAAGAKQGVPDILCLVPREPWHGLCIEMKAKGRQLTPEQKAMRFELSKRDYYYAVCRSADEALRVIEEYLGLKGRS